MLSMTIKTKYLGATAARPTRVKASCEVGQVTLTYDHKLTDTENHVRAAKALAVKKQWQGTYYGGWLTNSECVFVRYLNSGEHAFSVDAQEAGMKP